MKVLKKILLIIVAFALIVVIGAFAFRYFVTDRVMDHGGMENPDVQFVETVDEEIEQ